MIELFTLLTIVSIVVIVLFPGKTPPLESPLVINRPGQFHATLAPQLNLAQPLLEAITRVFIEAELPAGDCGTSYFRVRDKEVTAHGQPFYLLAISRREGVYYFQAISPSQAARNREEAGGYYATLQNFVAGVMESVPQAQVAEGVQARLEELAIQVASERGVTMERLLPGQ